MSDAIFYHYIPTSNDFLCDRPDLIEQEDQSNQTGVHRLGQLPDESTSEDEEEESSYDMDLVMEKIEFGVVQLPHMVWTLTKYKPQQVAQFITLLQNKNCKIREAASEARIEIDNA